MVEYLEKHGLPNYPRLFEDAFKDFVRSKHAVAVSSGTAALYTALMAMDFKVGSKIVTTPFTFNAPASMILALGGKPVFVDIDPETYCLDMEKVAEAVKQDGEITGILPVHLFGNMCDIDILMELREEKELFIIEDACQALGAKHDGKFAGTWGDIGCFSFYASKNLWTGGGMMVTDDAELANTARIISNNGMNETGKTLRLGHNHMIHWDDAYHGEKMVRMHKRAILSELGSYGPQDGYYPYVLYEQPLFLDFKADCPVAEKVAKQVRIREGKI